VYRCIIGRKCAINSGQPTAGPAANTLAAGSPSPPRLPNPPISPSSEIRPKASEGGQRRRRFFWGFGGWELGAWPATKYGEARRHIVSNSVCILKWQPPHRRPTTTSSTTSPSTPLCLISFCRRRRCRSASASSTLCCLCARHANEMS